MTPNSQATLEPHVRIDTPASWIQVTPIPTADDQARSREMVARLAAVDIPPAVPSAIRLMLARLLDDQAHILGYFLDLVDEGADAPPVLLAATVGVTVVGLDDDGNVDDLEDALRGRVLRDHLVLTDRVTCQGRQGIRTTARRSTDGASGADVEQLDVRIYVPVPEEAALLVAAFATPNVDLEDEWIELFTAIGETLGLDTDPPPSTA